MNVLPREKQIGIVAALTEGVSIRATEWLTGVDPDTIMRLSQSGSDTISWCALWTIDPSQREHLRAPRLFLGRQQR